MQRNRSYYDEPERSYRRNQGPEDQYYREDSRYRNSQPEERPWRPQLFPERYSSKYQEPGYQRHDYRQADYGDQEFRQDSRNRHYEHTGYRSSNPDRRHLDPSAYRGAYRLDVSGENRSEYRQLDRENFGDDYGYGHSGSSRTGGNRGRYQSDYGNGASYGASRNAGSMGSYGGAQGYGSSRNGGHNQEQAWASGHGNRRNQQEHHVYGAYRDKNSFAPGEQASYDGSQRYGSQGAVRDQDKWVNAGRQAGSRYRTSAGQDEDDSRYEIYDTALSQYNRGNYGNPTHGSISDELNLRSHQEYPPYQRYGSRQRSRYRQGSGNDQDQYGGAGGLGYNNTAGSLSIGYDGYRGPAEPRSRYYDPLSGQTRNPYY